MACTGDELAPPEPAPPAAAPAPQRDEPLLGVVAARSAVVAAQLEGRLTRILAIPGQRVRAGDPIAELESLALAERLQAGAAAVETARGDAEIARAEVVEARRQVALESRMVAAGAAAEEAVRMALARRTRAVASVERAKAVIREAAAKYAAIQAEQRNTHLAAPIDGVVSLVKVEPGDILHAGAMVARVLDRRKLLIRFQVPSERRREVALGAVVALTIDGADRPLQATVTWVSEELEPTLDFLVAEADLADASRDVRSGVLGEVRVVRTPP